MHERMSRSWTAIVLLVSIALMVPAEVAASDPTIRADLDGRPIPAIQVGDWYCHDFDYPLIHCFRTAADLDAAVASLGYESLGPGVSTMDGTSSVSPSGVLAVSYVRVFVDAGYAGSSAYFSVNYTNLGVIGWNDKISSFVGLDSATGQFFEHIYYTGFIFGFCCNTQVSYVGNSSNDRFSSVRRTN
jgi:hypothetical protein